MLASGDARLVPGYSRTVHGVLETCAVRPYVRGDIAGGTGSRRWLPMGTNEMGLDMVPASRRPPPVATIRATPEWPRRPASAWRSRPARRENPRRALESRRLLGIPQQGLPTLRSALAARRVAAVRRDRHETSARMSQGCQPDGHCPRLDSNQHVHNRTQAPQACASANSATRAKAGRVYQPRSPRQPDEAIGRWSITPSPKRIRACVQGYATPSPGALQRRADHRLRLRMFRDGFLVGRNGFFVGYGV